MFAMTRCKPRLLVFIVAYNAEKTISVVLRRIPPELSQDFDVEVLIIDDCSGDRTFERSQEIRATRGLPFRLHVLYNPVNQGYGGNQKIGFHYAIERGFDFVALVHGDGQYAPECLPDLVKPLVRGEADAVMGSRMLTAGAALKGGMPLYKYVGNRVLTWIQNRLLGTNFSEFHSGYRVYSTKALRSIPLELNTNAFHFDTEIIIQLVMAKLRLLELSIPTYYGDEICHVNGLRYAIDVLFTTVRARAQQLCLLYDRRFDCGPSSGPTDHYTLKLGYESPHSLSLSRIQPGSRVLDLGCAGGQLDGELRKQGCMVTGVDVASPPPGVGPDQYIQHDLDAPNLPVDAGDYDYILALDVIEHLQSPEAFVDRLHAARESNPDCCVIVSTGNVASIWTRIGLLFGQFNYGKRGILDITHTRLFTFGTLRRLVEQGGFQITETLGVPAPFPLALHDGPIARLLLAINAALIRVSRSLFSYQVFVVAKPLPSLSYLLHQAEVTSESRLAAIAVPLTRIDGIRQPAAVTTGGVQGLEVSVLERCSQKVRTVA
jgi:glycosyltransferase involved in cell wall biosynthesis